MLLGPNYPAIPWPLVRRFSRRRIGLALYRWALWFYNMATRLRVNTSMTPGSAPAPISSAASIYRDLETALLDPEMLDEGDAVPSPQASSTVKRVLEEAQGLLPAPMAHPHIEFFDSSIRLSWTNAQANVLLVIASSDTRPSYVYHASLKNGQVASHGTVEPTAPNLAHWLSQMR